jgi:hypothetical protein
VPVSRDEVRRMIAGELERLNRQVELALDALTAELRAELYQEVAAITARIDTVHQHALRALTRSIEHRR